MGAYRWGLIFIQIWKFMSRAGGGRRPLPTVRLTIMYQLFLQLHSLFPLVAAWLKRRGVLLENPSRLKLLAARLPLQLKTLQVQVIFHNLLLALLNFKIKRCIQLGGLTGNTYCSKHPPVSSSFYTAGWQLEFLRPDLSQPEHCHTDIPDKTSEAERTLP